MPLTDCAYLMTKEGHLYSSSVESLWYEASETTLLNLIANGASPIYSSDAPGLLVDRASCLCDQPISVEDVGTATRLVFDHADTGQPTTLVLNKSTLHYMSYLARYRDGPNAWAIVYRVFEKLGLRLQKNELAVQKFLSAISNPSLIYNLRGAN